MWSILIVTLPTQPNAVRLRIWRALKALGCVALRDGAYLLPLAQAPALEALADEIRAHGGTASVLTLSPKDEAQRLDILAQFDRVPAYADWHASLRSVQAEINATTPALSETEARRRVRGVADALAAITRIDYFPGAPTQQAQSDLALLRRALDARFSKGEPQATSGDIQTLDVSEFQNKRWASRARPWVDRMACAWLIARFIDRSAEFVWIDDLAQAPPAASRTLLGFDYDGARFTHVGNLVSFEVLLASFGLARDPRLQAIALVVHYLDAGGIPVPQAAGLEAVLGGLRELHANDDALVTASSKVFDALYASPVPAGGAQ
ncbi:MAG: chromate resistance protein ChrB domain-containing protein [Burkholderiaceae bacterium]